MPALSIACTQPGNSKTRSLGVERNRKSRLEQWVKPTRTHTPGGRPASVAERQNVAARAPPPPPRRDQSERSRAMRSLPQHARPRAARSQGPNRRPRRPTGPCPHGPDAAGPLPVSPRAHRDRPRPTELASLRPKNRANGGAHKHRHRPRTTKHPPSTDRAALSNAPQPIEHTAKHVTSSHLPWGGRMTGREQPNPPAGSRSEVAALTTGARLVWGSAPRRVPDVPRRDLRKGTRSGNASIVRPEPAMAAASASTSRCSKRRRGSARPPSRRRD